MTPADELRTAAAKIRNLATTTAPGPWTATRWHSDTCGSDCDDPTCFMLLVSTPTGLLGDANVDRDGVFAVERSVHEQGEADAAYIAAMGPPVALALATVFDAWARMGDMDPDLLNRVGGRETLAVARAVLGSSDG